MKTLVIGAGRMGRRHVQIVQELGLDLIGVVDHSQAALDETAAQFDLPEHCLFTDPLDAFKQAPRCVIVATTAPAHAELVCAAAETGARFILCEKPLAVSLQQCDRMIEVCQKHGAALAVNHQMRFMEQYTAPKQLINSPALGGLCSVCVTAGNFGLAMNGSHYFEMFRYMTDEPPKEVAAWFSAERVPNPRGPQFEDRAGCVRLSTGSGKRFYLDCSADQGHGMQAVYGCRFGQVIVDELAGQMTWHCRREEHRDKPTSRYGMPWLSGQQSIAPADALTPSKAVLQALLQGEDHPTGEDGRLAVAVLVAAEISDAENHRTATLDEADEHAGRVFPWA